MLPIPHLKAHRFRRNGVHMHRWHAARVRFQYFVKRHDANPKKNAVFKYSKLNLGPLSTSAFDHQPSLSRVQLKSRSCCCIPCHAPGCFVAAHDFKEKTTSATTSNATLSTNSFIMRHDGRRWKGHNSNMSAAINSQWN